MWSAPEFMRRFEKSFLSEVIFDHLISEISCFHWQGLPTLQFVFALNRSDKQSLTLRTNINFSII